MASILVHIELLGERPHPFSIEALKTARHVSSALGATLYAVLPCDSPPLYGEDDLIAVLSRSGADKVILMTHPSLGAPARYFGHGSALLDACKQFRPALLFVPETSAGRDIAPAIASSLGGVFFSRPSFSRSKETGWTVGEFSVDGKLRRELVLEKTDRAIVTLFRHSDIETFPTIKDEAEVVVLSPGGLDKKVHVHALEGGFDVKPGNGTSICLIAGASLKKETVSRLRREAAHHDLDFGLTWEAYEKGLGDVSEVLGAGAELPLADTVVCFGIAHHHVELVQRGRGRRTIVVTEKEFAGFRCCGGEECVGDADEIACGFLDLLEEKRKELPDEGEKDNPSEQQDLRKNIGPISWKDAASRIDELKAPVLKDSEGLIMVFVSPSSLQLLGTRGTSTYDGYALFCAKRIHEKNGLSVVVVCCGPEGIESELSAVTAEFGFRGVRVWDKELEGAGYRAYERVLAGAVETFSPSLVLTGDRSPVWSHGLLGPAVARKMDWPHITGAFDVSLLGEKDKSRAVAGKISLGRLNFWSFSLPGVISVAGEPSGLVDFSDEEFGRNKSAEVDQLSLNDLGITKVDLGPLCRRGTEIKNYDGVVEGKLYKSCRELFSELLSLLD